MLNPMNAKQGAAYLGLSLYRFNQLPIDPVELKNGGRFFTKSALDAYVEQVTAKPREVA